MPKKMLTILLIIIILAGVFVVIRTNRLNNNGNVPMDDEGQSQTSTDPITTPTTTPIVNPPVATSTPEVGSCKLEKKQYSCQNFVIGDKIEAISNNNVEVFKISYKSEGLKITGALAKPKNISDKAPLLMYNHGGVNGIRNTQGEWIRRFAENGYVVLASTYRGESDITGTSQGEIEVAKGEVSDVLNLLECGKKLSYVDPEKIVAIGFSHGGGITVQAIELSKQFKAAAEFYGLTDVEAHYQRYVSGDVSGAENDLRFEVFDVFKQISETERNKELAKRQAIDCVKNISAPLLVIHGKADTNIPVSEAQDLINELKKYKKRYSYKFYEGQAHGFNFKPSAASDDSFNKVLDWFKAFLTKNTASN